jgi:hypothetical protein
MLPLSIHLIVFSSENAHDRSFCHQKWAKSDAERQHYTQERDSLIPIGGFSQLKGYSFQTNFWRDAEFAYFELAKSHRQSDKALIDALGEVRSGNISPKTVDFFKVISEPPSMVR